MAILPALLRNQWLTGLVSLEKPEDFGVAGWLASGDYASYTPPAADEVDLAIADWSTPSGAFANELNRFASAAIESSQAIVQVPGLPRSKGWPYIKGYYAAFYGAHALMRVFGRSCSQVEQGHVLVLNNVLQTYHHGCGVLPKGLYSVKCFTKQGSIRLKKSSGHTHEELWALFHDLLRDLSSGVLASGGVSADTQEMADFLDTLRKALFPSGRVSFLSRTRNQVTYRHEFGAWYPYSGSTKGSARSCVQTLGRWREDPATVLKGVGALSDPDRFIRTCAVVVGLMRIVVDDLSKARVGRRLFTDCGPGNLLRQIR